MCRLCEAYAWRGGAMCPNCAKAARIAEQVEVWKSVIPLLVDALMVAIKQYDEEQRDGKTEAS